MTSRNVVKLFFTTLLIGGFVTGITGFVVRWEEFSSYFTNIELLSIVSTFFWLFCFGFIFSLVSQVAFFAYLTVHRFGLGIFRSFWSSVQVVLIAFALFDLVYFRYKAFAQSGDSVVPYIFPAIMLLVIGLFIGFLKAKQTNKAAFIPAVFFMTVVTIIEWAPILRLNDDNWTYLMIFPLLACNIYQLLILHKLNEDSIKEKSTKIENPA
ncbi:KinB-signaling pathway activation protein [Niallia sp. Krafla_26]|uniref:KinB-signaling pathway activation protein n=1 Tax=Niallia sp. Krafla_26 TaxID=3064703 RepID=UPI003D1799E7